MTKYIDCVVSDTCWLTPKTLRIRFKPIERIQFKAGQFLTLAVPYLYTKGRAEWRSFSFSNAPKQTEIDGYEILVHYVKDGASSEYLSQLKIGNLITISAPHGDFTYQIPDTKSVCFIATSSGIAPFMAMIQSDEFKRNRAKKTFLLLGLKSDKELYLIEPFLKIGIEVLPCISHPELITKGLWGRLTDYLTRKNLPFKFKETDFYLCGNPTMKQDVLHILKSNGVLSNSIFVENYQLSFQALRFHSKVAPFTTNTEELIKKVA